VGYVRDLDSLLGTWSWKLNELKKDKADVEKLTRPISKLARIIERFEKEKGITVGVYSKVYG
jgi:hypothetical protein